MLDIRIRFTSTDRLTNRQTDRLTDKGRHTSSAHGAQKALEKAKLVREKALLQPKLVRKIVLLCPKLIRKIWLLPEPCH